MKRQAIDYTRAYGVWHDDTDTHFESMARMEGAWLTPYLPNNKGARILDIGCGMGFAIAGIVRRGYADVQGIDADSGQAAKAQKRGLAVQHVPVADTIRWLAEREGTYELILAIDVLEHVPPAGHIEFLGAVREALQVDGAFLCRVPNANSILGSRYRYGDWTHHTSFTEQSLDFVLYNAGFDDIAVRDAEPYRWRLGYVRHPRLVLLGVVRWVRRLQMIAELGSAGSEVPLSPNICAHARRAAPIAGVVVGG